MTEPGGPDFLEQVQQMMGALQDARDELDTLEVQGTAGGGAVRVVVTGAPEVRRVELTDEALEDREMLPDLIAAAVNDGLRKVAEATRDRLGGLGI